MNAFLSQQLALHALTISADQVLKLEHYIELLQRWNKVYNLIGNAEMQQIVDRHIIDSLLAAPYLQGPRIVDVGTGAGLPGIPLAILLPEYQFTLLDSNGKKTRFVTQATVELALNNVTVIQDRVENVHPVPLFDSVITRAFAQVKEMLHLTAHLCVADGKFIALKGDDLSELAELPEGFRCVLQERLPFADKSINRQIVIIKKG